MNIVKRIIRSGANLLTEDTKGWEYIRSRGVTPEEIREYDLGYYPEDEWPPYIEEGESKEGDRYRNWSGRGVKLKDSVVFPLRNALGEDLGFILRDADPNGNYREFRLLKAKPVEVFFGVREAMESIWKTGDIYLVEGLFDLFPVSRVYDPTVCVVTARVDPKQARFIRRLANKVHFLFDNDRQGRDGFEEFRNEHQHDFEQIDEITYKGEDPADAASQVDDFAEHLKSSRDPLGLGLGEL